MKLRILFIGLLYCVFGSIETNAQLLQWNTFGNTGLETSETSTYNNANITASNLTPGSITAAGNANRLGGSNWFDTGDANPTTLAESITGNDYIQFIVTPNAGSTFTPTSFVFSWDHSAAGPNSVALRSSADGYAANLGTLTGLAASITTGNTITISGLTNIATATTFRLYGYGATNTAGTGGFDVASNIVNVTLNGTTTSTSCTPPTISSLSPAAGIIGSQVTITASSGSLSGATAVFNGVTATTVSSSATQLVVTVPTGATTGNLVVTDTQPCATTTTFTVLPTPSACSILSDLIISEVTDTNYGGLSYIEIYNGTGITVDLSKYNLQFYSNGASSPYATTGVSGVPAFTGMLGNDQTYTVSTAPSASQCGITGGNGSLANLITSVNGVNFGTNADDQIVLYKGITKIDSWGDATGNWSSSLGIGTSGAVFRRNPTAATLPNGTYSNADWTVTDWAGSGSGACPTNDYSDIGTYNYTPTSSTTWNGSGWSNGTPTLSLLTIINGAYSTAVNGNFEACSLIVKDLKTLTITANQYVAIQYNLTVKPTGNIIVNDNGSLIQIDDSGVNSGSIDVKRVATIKKTDYVYWSSPVSGFGVQSISPGSPASLIWKWNTTLANSNGGEGNWQNTSEIMQECKGYIVRGPDSYNNTTAADYTATFTGTPFNGVCQPSIFRGNDTNAGSVGPNGVMRTIKDDNWNLLGNPYPSSISAIKFLTLNTNIDGNIRLWTHGTLPSAAVSDPFYGNFVYNYDPSDYITYNITGASTGPSAFNGYIASGQGFFVIMNDGAADATQKVTFNNSLRETVGATNTYYDNSYFYKTTATTPNSPTNQKGRIWLDVINNSTGKTSRALVGYLSGATLAKDRLYDAFFVVGNSMSIFSLIDDEAMSIQGRPAPFRNDDVVPIGVRISTAGSYAIALGAIDGLFENPNKDIYIEDTITGVVQDLRVAPYTFTSDAGKFINRFKLRYQNRPNTRNDKPDNNTPEKVLVYTNQNTITAYSFSEKITNIKIYDMLGRAIDEAADVNNQEVIMNLANLNHQPIILKITLANNEIVSKKILF